MMGAEADIYEVSVSTKCGDSHDHSLLEHIAIQFVCKNHRHTHLTYLALNKELMLRIDFMR